MSIVAPPIEPRIGSLFSGYGGLDLAIREVFPEAETAFVADIDPGSCKVLAHRFPDAPNLGDVSQVDWTEWMRLIFILSAGFPCQDVSAAGKRAGLKEGTRTGLWHETARAIRELRPPLVFLENVRGLLSARGDEPSADHLASEATAAAAKRLTDWIDRRHAIAVRHGRTEDARRLADRRFRAMGCHKRAVDRARRHERRLVRAVGTVLGSLADLGYDAAWVGLRAADVGAPHGRWRIFILGWPSGSAVADAECGGQPRRARLAGRESVGRAAAQGTGSLLPTPTVSDGNGAGQHGDGGLDLRTAVSLLGTPTARDHKGTGPAGSDSHSWLLEHGNVEAQVLSLLPTPAVNDMGAGKTPEDWDAWTERMKAAHGNGNGHGASLSIEAMRLLPTPTTQPMTGNGHARDLNAETKLLPTPMVGSTSPAAHGQISGQWREQMADALANWGKYTAAIERWERSTRPTPAPTEVGPKGNPRLSCHFDEWLMGLPAGWITEVPDITHNETLKLCGNGVVPQQGAAALRHLLSVRAYALGVAA